MRWSITGPSSTSIMQRSTAGIHSKEPVGGDGSLKVTLRNSPRKKIL